MALPDPRCPNTRHARFASSPAGTRIKRLRLACCLLFAAAPVAVCAQNVWTYEVLQPDNRISVAPKPPHDISYPPAGQHAGIAGPNEHNVVPISAAEAADRRRAPKLIILLAPEFPATQL
jgi:hypothetical protein